MVYLGLTFCYLMNPLFFVGSKEHEDMVATNLALQMVWMIATIAALLLLRSGAAMS